MTVNKKIIAYGLGFGYEKIYKSFLESNGYEIVAVSDINNDFKDRYDSFIAAVDLPEFCRNNHVSIMITIYVSHNFQAAYYYLKNLFCGNVTLKIGNQLLDNTGDENAQVINIAEYERINKIASLGKSFSYSAGGEDLVLEYIFEKIFHRDHITYLETGVWDRILHSNTYKFYTDGSGRGLLVDANPEIADWVKLVRREDNYLTSAIGEKSGDKVKFYLAHDRSASSLDESWIKTHGQTVDKVFDVPTIDVNSLFEKMNGHVDLWSLDLEGYDRIALKSVDFSKYRPSVIIFENSWNMNDIYSFLIEQGYECFYSSEVNLIYIDKMIL